MINMSMINLQWSALGGVLLIEMICTIILLLPFIPAKFWHAFFNSKPVQKLAHWKYTKAGLHIGAFVMFLFLGDAIRSMYVYGQTKDVQAASPVMSTADKDALINMRMYRAERNFFIVFFTLFFGALLRRLVGLICLEAELMAEADGSMSSLERLRQERAKTPKVALDKLAKDE